MPLWTVVWNFPWEVLFLRWEGDLPMQVCWCLCWVNTHALAVLVKNQLWLRVGWGISPWPLMLIDGWSTDIHPCGLPCIYQLYMRGLNLQTFFLLKTLKAKLCIIVYKLHFPECFLILLRITYGITLSASLDPSHWTKKFRAEMFSSVASRSQGLGLREIIWFWNIFFFNTILISLVKWHLRSIQISKLILSAYCVQESLLGMVGNKSSRHSGVSWFLSDFFPSKSAKVWQS